MKLDKNQTFLSDFRQKTCVMCGKVLLGQNLKACLCRMCEMGVPHEKRI